MDSHYCPPAIQPFCLQESTASPRISSVSAGVRPRTWYGLKTLGKLSLPELLQNTLYSNFNFIYIILAHRFHISLFKFLSKLVTPMSLISIKLICISNIYQAFKDRLKSLLHNSVLHNCAKSQRKMSQTYCGVRGYRWRSLLIGRGTSHI